MENPFFLSSFVFVCLFSPPFCLAWASFQKRKKRQKKTKKDNTKQKRQKKIKTKQKKPKEGKKRQKKTRRQKKLMILRSSIVRDEVMLGLV
jgi:hypothetical protein